SDATPAILDRLAREDPRVAVVRVDDLPAGWLGKSHALAKGTERATGDWLLFIDADTWLAPDAARTGVDLARRHDAGHVCLAPAMASSTLPGRATLLAAMLLYAGRALTVHAQRLGGYMGVGAYNLVRTDAYRAAGGHDALKLDILDDVKLALLANRAGARTRTAFAPDLVEVEWAGSARGFVALLRKNAFASQDYSTLRTAMIAGVAVAMLLAPLAACVVFVSAESALLRAACAFCVFAYLAPIAPAAWIARRFRWGAPAVAFSPLGHWVVVAAGLNSAVRTLAAGGVRWRDTFYPLRELRRALVR
ncbi:MAG: glycosyltransferase, partial [Phycisphaerales bacterium]